MPLTELGINQVFAPLPSTKAAKQRQPFPPTAGQLDGSTPRQGEPDYPAHSTPRQSGVVVGQSPADLLAGQAAGRPSDTPSGAALQEFFHYLRSFEGSPDASRRFVAETPGAWRGASMASYDLSTDLILDGFESQTLSNVLAGQPLLAGDISTNIGDAAQILTQADIDKLLSDASPASQPDLGFSAFLKDLPALTLSHGITSRSGASNPPAGQPVDHSSYSEPAWPLANDVAETMPPTAGGLQLPESSSSGSSSHAPDMKSTPSHTPMSSTQSKSPSISAAALIEGDEAGNPFWDQIVESSFNDEEDSGNEIEAFKKRAKIICSTYYKDTYGHTSGNLPPDSRTAIKFCRQLTRGLVEFLCQHYNLQQQRVWKEIGAFVGWARSINAWNMFQRKWRDELPDGEPFNSAACRAAYTEQAAQDPVELHARLSAWHEAHMAPDGRAVQPAERRKLMADLLKCTKHMYSMYDRCCDIGARVEIGSLHPLDGADMYHVYETKRMQGYTEEAYRRTPDGCKIAWVYFTAKQAHGQANNPPPEVKDRRRPENLKVAREEIQRTGKHLLHEMKLLSDPNAVQPASCPWRASWLKLAVKHKCTIINWPAEGRWPHELAAQLQNSVEDDLVPIWRAFTTQNPAEAVRVELWSKEAIQDPMKHNPRLIVRSDGQPWTYRDEENRVLEPEDDDLPHDNDPPQTKRVKHGEETSQPSQRPKARHAARKALRLASEAPSASERIGQSKDGDSGPAGPPSERINRPHSIPFKRKISDILEDDEEELPSAEAVAFEQDHGLQVRPRDALGAAGT
ncbi:hypothetical protein CALCODRAFT_482604 [Calocera cornea HHB12733]|uniref:Uncharacterized protein n=1 Tax=Calocera cornea HHB12733 TaxID=1353952 RepID=A0A165GH22_9BASI|nr:hypothetical protein CALCODRAFT_482604 [Calocera cornea HHB12733]